MVISCKRSSEPHLGQSLLDQTVQNSKDCYSTAFHHVLSDHPARGFCYIFHIEDTPSASPCQGKSSFRLKQNENQFISDDRLYVEEEKEREDGCRSSHDRTCIIRAFRGDFIPHSQRAFPSTVIPACVFFPPLLQFWLQPLGNRLLHYSRKRVPDVGSLLSFRSHFVYYVLPCHITCYFAILLSGFKESSKN